MAHHNIDAVDQAFRLQPVILLREGERRIGRNVGSQLTSNTKRFEDPVLWGTERLGSATEHSIDGSRREKTKTRFPFLRHSHYTSVH
jgi:hypothetical protein